MRSVRRSCWVLASLLSLLAISGPALAANDARADPASYRGRAHRTTAGDVARWIPRVLLFPLYALNEYIVRRPVIAAARWTESSHVARYVDHVMHPVPNFAWAPTLVLDVGLRTTVGARMRWRDALVPSNELRLGASTGGLDVLQLAGEDRFERGIVAFGIHGGFLTRPDRPFYGIGPRASPADLTYARITRREAWAFVTLDPSTHVALELVGTYRSEDIAAGEAPSIDTRFQVPAEVPGYGRFGLLVQSLTLSLDTRSSATRDGGLRLDATARHAIDPFDPGLEFVQVEGTLEGAYEIGRPGRVLSASIYGGDTTALGPIAVPFTELFSLGGAHHEGFRWGRYVDSSVVLAEIAYRQPVWERLDAIVRTSVGNVFGTHFDGFDPRLFTGSLGIGLRTRLANSDAIETVLAFGTNRFDEPFGIESVRFYTSINRGL